MRPRQLGRSFRLGCTTERNSATSPPAARAGEGLRDRSRLMPVAFTRYWDAVVEPAHRPTAGPAGRKHLESILHHGTSWEIDVCELDTHPARGISGNGRCAVTTLMPLASGHHRQDCEQLRTRANRFLADFRRTWADLAILTTITRLFKEGGAPARPAHPSRIRRTSMRRRPDRRPAIAWAWMTHRWGERSSGRNPGTDAHRLGDENRFFVKQPASCGRTTYGHKLRACGRVHRHRAALAGTVVGIT